MNKILSSFKKMDKWVVYLLGGFLVLLLLTLFYPKKPTGVKLVPVPGTSYYKAVLEGFSDDINHKGPLFVFWGTEWCGYCKKFKPVWDNLFKSYKGDVKLVYVDCDKDKDLATKHKVQGYPTIRYYKNGLDPKMFSEYSGERTVDVLHDYLKNPS